MRGDAAGTPTSRVYRGASTASSQDGDATSEIRRNGATVDSLELSRELAARGDVVGTPLSPAFRGASMVRNPVRSATSEIRRSGSTADSREYARRSVANAAAAGTRPSTEFRGVFIAEIQLRSTITFIHNCCHLILPRRTTTVQRSALPLFDLE